MENREAALQQHPRMGFFSFTGSVADIALDSIRAAAAQLGKGVRRILKAVRSYKGSYYQAEVRPSAATPGAANCHVHAAVFIPGKGKPTAEDVDVLWQDALGLSARSSDWTAVRDPAAWAYYSTKRPDLSGWDEESFGVLADQLHGQKLRGWIN